MAGDVLDDDSGIPPTALATTGVSQAMASRLVSPKGSYTEGQRKTEAAVRIWVSSACDSISSIQTTRPRRAAREAARRRISSPMAGVSGAPAQKTNWASGSIDSAATRAWSTPFCRVIRPTKTTDGRFGSTPRRSKAPVSATGRQASVSIPLWITATRSGSKPG